MKILDDNFVSMKLLIGHTCYIDYLIVELMINFFWKF